MTPLRAKCIRDLVIRGLWRRKSIRALNSRPNPAAMTLTNQTNQMDNFIALAHSVEGMTVDMLQSVSQMFLTETTLKEKRNEILYVEERTPFCRTGSRLF
jgi:hypothetical protein